MIVYTDGVTHKAIYLHGRKSGAKEEPIKQNNYTIFRLFYQKKKIDSKTRKEHNLKRQNRSRVTCNIAVILLVTYYTKHVRSRSETISVIVYDRKT